MAVFSRQDLHGSTFDEVDLRGARFRHSDLSGAELRGTLLHHARLRGVELYQVAITGEILDLTINGVEVGGYVEAELDRRDPDRSKMRPTGPAGFRAAWDILEHRWAETVSRARTLPPDLLHTSVDDEWSFIETLRHLAFATDAWLRRAILGDPAPWHPLDLPWDEMPDRPGIPRDREIRPTLEEVLALRRNRTAGVRAYLDRLTDEALAADTEPAGRPGWPDPISYPVRECLLIILNEEWHHRLFAERDLDILDVNPGRAGGAPDGLGASGHAC